MDANGSRYHALVTAADWLGCVAAMPAEAPPDLAWDGAGLLVLKPLLYEFRPARATLVALPEPGSRAGGCVDAHGNLYALAADGSAIRIRSVGSGAVSDFWPLPAAGGALVAGRGLAPAGQGVGTDFAPLPPDPAVAAPLLDALALTTGQYLVAASQAAQGLLIVDLCGGGPPLFQSWPGMPAPEALCALEDGGLALLHQGWLHRLGPDLRPCVPASGSASAFAPRDAASAGAGTAAPPAAATPPCRIDLRPALGSDAWVGACALLPGGRVLVLGRRSGETRLRLGLIALDGQVLAVRDAAAPDRELPALDALIGAVMARDPAAAATDPDPDRTAPPLSQRSLALEWPAQPSSDSAIDAIGANGAVGAAGADFHAVLLAAGGDQAFRFAARWTDAGGGTLLVALQRDYLPLRRYQAGGLASLAPGQMLHDWAAARAFYAADGRWAPLLALPQPRCARDAMLDSPVWDSAVPECVWHRIVLEARIPPGGQIRLQSRAADDRAALARQSWRDEPALLAHPRGSELPWRDRPAQACADLRSLTCLLQDAHGRWLQLRLHLSGDGQQSPGLAALRVWYPRFSYLQQYLPAVHRADAASASFTDRLLALFEGEFTRWEDRIAAAQLLLDARSAPQQTLDWLAGWVALAFDPSTGLARRRALLRHAVAVHGRRGTVPGLLLAATLAWEPDGVDVEPWLRAPETLADRPGGVRLQELFGLTPPLPAAAWRPALGAADLLDRLGGAGALVAGAAGTAGGTGLTGTTGATTTTGTSAAALQAALGFLPRGAQEEEALRLAWQLPALPEDEPVDAATRAAFDVYLAASQPCAPLRQRWQDFLARRWRRIAALNAAWGTRWTAFTRLPSCTRLPAGSVALADWHLFESQVLRGLANAHRFRIVLPLPAGVPDLDALARRRAAVWRAIERDRPAHTVAELRFGFELFRVGAARLGLDTRLEQGLTRRPELAALGAALSAWPPLVLGQNALGGAQLASARPLPPPDRIGLDRGAPADPAEPA